MAILAVNAGSSSLKFSIHPIDAGKVYPSVFSGNFQGLEPGGTPLLGWTFKGQEHTRQLTASMDSFGQALGSLVELLAADADIPSVDAIAHRVVHGGQEFSTSVLITEQVLSKLEGFVSLAPLHQPANLQGIRAFQKAFPTMPQVACFDTAFHSTLSELDYLYALPQAITQQGVRRYGFHGLSYQYVMGALQQLSSLANGRVLMAHLGNGSSLCAAHQGRSVGTTMGFSALAGVVMGTRSGSLDSGVLLYLLEQGWDHDRLQTMLYKQSGLLGVSGISADMRRLREDRSASAKLAIDLFTQSIVRELGALIACMGGFEVLSFSGGIGENDAQLRAEVCERLAWLGVTMDPALNQQAVKGKTMAIHSPESRVQVWVVPTDEGIVAAREAQRLTGSTFSDDDTTSKQTKSSA